MQLNTIDLVQKKDYRSDVDSLATRVNAVSEITGYSHLLVRKYFKDVGKKITEGKWDSRKTDYFFRLVQALDNETSPEAIESLMKDEYSGLKKISVIEAYPNTGWRKVDKLGLEYYKDRLKGYGDTIRSRSENQIGLANQIVVETYSLLNQIAGSYFGKGPIERIYFPKSGNVPQLNFIPFWV